MKFLVFSFKRFSMKTEQLFLIDITKLLWKRNK